MAFKIGFATETSEKKNTETIPSAPKETIVPRKSVVQVHFPTRNMKLAYYNDQFDLHCGDLVYVDGKLEGLRGRVTEVNYNFKIKVAAYKRVIAVVDTAVHGEFFMAGSHFVTFDDEALPREKAALWFRAPQKADEEIIFGTDDTMFLLDDLKAMKVSPTVAQRGHEYYMDNRVRYLCVDNGEGYAIVEGSEAYEVEFTYWEGAISNLTCSCFCSYNCKHEFAAMLQLQETLDLIMKNYADKFEDTGYFAAVGKGPLFSFAVDGRETGSFTL